MTLITVSKKAEGQSFSLPCKLSLEAWKVQDVAYPWILVANKKHRNNPFPPIVLRGIDLNQV